MVKLPWTIAGTIVALLGMVVALFIAIPELGHNEALVASIIAIVASSIPSLIASAKSELAAKKADVVHHDITNGTVKSKLKEAITELETERNNENERRRHS